MRRTQRWTLLALAACFTLLSTTNSQAQWPNNPDDNPLDATPNDPGYVSRDGDGNIIGGDWNLWSFTPDAFDKVVASERALGTGLHADRAWQITPGDARVVIAVLDSGIKWDERDLANKAILNRAELEAIGDAAKPLGPPMQGGDDWDINGDGILTVMDYTINDAGTEIARFDQNATGFIDGQDFIMAFSDGNDDDGNGFVDDISGWDFMWNDNDPNDDTRFGHGTGEAKDSAAEGNNGIGSLGVCPNCTVMHMRVGDSFVVDSNDFGDAVVYAVDNGALVIQEALGAMNMTPLAHESIEYAYANNVAVVASAADELSFHHNLPGTTNHTIYVHAVVHDKGSSRVSTTFLNFNNCTNYGGQLLLSTPGSGCSSEAVGITSGHVGLIYSAAIGAPQNNVPGGLTALDPPLSSEEVRAILINSADDINVAGSENDSTKFPSGPGWDWHFGYGRNNARTSLDMIVSGAIPPEADIEGPLWFEVLFPDRISNTVSITGRVGERVDGLAARYDSYDYTLEYALGVDPKGGWKTIKEATGVEAFAGEIAAWDVSNIDDELDINAPSASSHDDTITLRLRVSATTTGGDAVTNEFRKSIFLHRDPDLLAGFPKYFGGSLESSMKFANLDDDAGEELVFAANDGLLHVIDQDGSEMAGFPVPLGLRKGHVAGEADSHEAACAYMAPGDRPDGCPEHGRVTFEVRHGLVATVAIGDLEGDGSAMELVVSTFEGYVFAFRNDGTVVDGFPVRTNPEYSSGTDQYNRLDEGIFASPALYDLDGDGDLEIINGAMDQHMYVFHHDGTLFPNFPILLRDTSDPVLYNLGERIVASTAVGDIDNDGVIEIISPTNEFYDGNRVRLYIIDSSTGQLEGGGPLIFSGLLGEVLPIVGRGIAGAPVIANIDRDDYLEFNAEGIAGQPTMRTWDGTTLTEKSRILSASNDFFGANSNSNDDGALPLLSNGIFARLDLSGDLAYVKGTAGYQFALAFAGGGERGYFDHQLTAWNSITGEPLVGFPQVVDDWQFIAGPSAADIDGDFNVEVLVGTGGYRVHAFNYEGTSPTGWPKLTGGWIIGTPAIGDFDGDGFIDVAAGTRAGWLYVWKTTGKMDGPMDWRFNNHDLRNTNNYEEPFVGQGTNEPVDPEVDAGEDTATDDTTTTSEDATNTAEGTADEGGSVTGGGGDDDCSCQALRAPTRSRSTLPLLLVGAVFGFLALRRRRRRDR